MNANATNSYCDAKDEIRNCDLYSYTPSGHSFWLPGLDGVTKDFHFEEGTGRFRELPNGRAVISGFLANEQDPNQRWKVNIFLSNKSDWDEWSANGGSYKDEQNIVDQEYKDWTYYIIDTTKVSKLTGQGSLTGSYLKLTHMPSNFLYGCQIGEAANSKNAEYGMACWFFYDGKVNGETVSGHGDYNLISACSPGVRTESNDTVTCSNSSVQISAYSDYSYVSYSWAGPGGFTSNAQHPSVSLGGVYRVTATSDEGCTSKAIVKVASNLSKPKITGTVTEPTCNGDTDGSIDITVTGNNPPYTFLWPNGETTEDISGVGKGNYRVTVTGSNGCSQSRTFRVLDRKFIAVAKKTNATCYQGEDGVAWAYPIRGTGPYSYLWSNGATTDTITGLGLGSYTVTITDANGCESSRKTRVGHGTKLMHSFTSVDGTCEQPEGSISASVHANHQNRVQSITWSNGATGANNTGLESGTYTVTISYDNGCEIVETFELAELPCCNVTFAGELGNSQENCGGFDPDPITSISLPSGGIGTLEYVWLQRQPGQAFTMITGANGPTYDPGYITTTMQYRRCARRSGCTQYIGETNWITMTVNNAGEFAEVTAENGTCNNNNLGSATATGGASYAWSNGATTASINGLGAGTYTVTATSANGCTDTEEVTIEVVECCNVTAAGELGNEQENCGGFDPDPITSISLPSGGIGTLEYVWLQRQPGQAFTMITGANGPTYDPGYITTTMEYRRCARRSGCVQYIGESNWITMSVNEAPDVELAITNGGCEGGLGSITAMATGNGPFTYSWNIAMQNSATVSNLQSGTYTVVVTNNSGCTATASGTVENAEPAEVDVDVTNGTCNNYNLGSATATGGTSYAWSNGATTASISGLGAGTYTVTATNGSGCTAVEEIDIEVVECCNVTAAGEIGNEQENCGGFDPDPITSISLPSGGIGTLEYVWLQRQPGQAFSMISGANGPTYDPGYITTTMEYRRCARRSGCVQYIGESNWITMSVNEAPDVELAITNGGCEGGLGSITAMATGNGPFTYSWNIAMQNSATVSNLQSGTYTVVVTNNSGCTATASGTVENAEPAEVDVDITNGTCNNNNLGSATATGGASYAWSNGATTASISGLGAGTYTVTATNGSGCTAVEEIDIEVVECCNVTAAGEIGNEQENCGGFDPDPITSISMPSGGIGTLEYVWLQRQPGQAFSMISGANGPTYDPGYITTTMQYRRCARRSGCTQYIGESNWITMTVHSAGEFADISAENGTCNNNNLGSATATGGASYAWSNGATTASINGLGAGTYTVTATSANGCTDTEEITIEVVECCNVTSAGELGNEQENCGGFDPDPITSISLPSGGVGTLEYVWLQREPGQAFSMITGANGPTYDPGYITTTMQYRRCARRSGCTQYIGESNWITMTVKEVPEFATKFKIDGGSWTYDSTVTVCKKQKLYLGINPSNFYSISWTGPNGFTSTASHPLISNCIQYEHEGDYKVTVTGSNGCSVTKTIKVEVGNCCGEIYALKIYDQSTDQEISGIGAITEGMMISEANLPANYYLVVEASNEIESVKIKVDGNSQSAENIVPYTWPNGAENGGNWNGGEGTFTVEAWAYTEDNYCSPVCDEISISFTIVDACDNLTSAGEIGNAQENCGGFDPDPITSVSLPTGGSGNIEYVWLQREPGQSYSVINGADGPTYDPGYINTTMQYRRCARRSGCSSYVAESNWITITVNTNCINPPTESSCDEENFYWENDIDASQLSGSYGIPYAALRMKGNGVTSYTIPGPYPSEFDGPVYVSVEEAISWDAYLSRANTGDQPYEQWKLVFLKDGQVVQSTDYTGDLNTGVTSAEWVGSLGSDIYLPEGTDQIMIVHYENSQYGEGSAPSANSVVPVSVCISYEGGCDNVVDGGMIGNAQSSCVAFDPEAITNVTSPSGGSGNLEYQWYKRLSMQTPQLIVGATSATYDPGYITESTEFMRAARRSGCEDYVGESNWITMAVENNLIIDINATSPLCAGGTGMLEAMAYGSIGMVSYSWNNGSTMSLQVGLGSGNYVVTATDEGGCVVTDSAEITIPEILTVSVATTDLTYLASDDGTATATVNGGTPTYTFDWSNGESTSFIDELPINTYTVTVTDANGCTAEAEGEVLGPVLSKGGNTQSENTEYAIEISAYPNPASVGQPITIVANGFSESVSADATLYDLQGQLIMKERLTLGASSDNVSLDLRGKISTGTYLLRIESDLIIETIPIQIVN